MKKIISVIALSTIANVASASAMIQDWYLNTEQKLAVTKPIEGNHKTFLSVDVIEGSQKLRNRLYNIGHPECKGKMPNTLLGADIKHVVKSNNRGAFYVKFDLLCKNQNLLVATPSNAVAEEAMQYVLFNAETITIANTVFSTKGYSEAVYNLRRKKEIKK